MFSTVKVKVQKRFPLTSIVDIIYDEIDNPMEFKLIFQNSEVVLEAHDHGSCKQWVENIKKGKYTLCKHQITVCCVSVYNKPSLTSFTTTNYKILVAT